MEVSEAVEVLEALEDLKDNGANLAFGEGGLAELKYVFLDKLEDDVEVVVMLEDGFELDDVGVVELSKC